MTNAIPTEEDNIATLQAVKDKIETRISEIKQISDTGEKLLAYKELRDGYKELFEPDDGKKASEYLPEASIKEDMVDNANFFGALKGTATGVAGGVGAGLGIATVLTGGLAAVAIVPGLVVLVGAAKLGGALGRRKGQKKFKKLPALQQLASQLYELDRSVNKSIKELGATDDKNLNTLARSSRFEDIKKAFPDLAAIFTKKAEDARATQAAIEKRRAFLNGAAAEPAPAAGEAPADAHPEKNPATDKPAAARRRGPRVDADLLNM